MEYNASAILLTLISIHAPTRGATLLLLAPDDIPAIISIHAPTRGATGNKC